MKPPALPPPLPQRKDADGPKSFFLVCGGLIIFVVLASAVFHSAGDQKVASDNSSKMPALAQLKQTAESAPRDRPQDDPSWSSDEMKFAMKNCSAVADRQVDNKPDRSIDNSTLRKAAINLCLGIEKEYHDRLRLESPAVPAAILKGCAEGVSERANPSFEAWSKCVTGMLDRMPENQRPGGWSAFYEGGTLIRNFWNQAACMDFRTAFGHGTCVVH